MKLKWAEFNILFFLLGMSWLGTDGFLAVIWGHCSSWTHSFASSSLEFSGDRWLAFDTPVRVLSSKQATFRVDSLSFLDLLVTFWCLLENSVRDSRALAKVEWCWICCLTHLESPKIQWIQVRNWLVSYQNIYALRLTLLFLVKQFSLHLNIWNSFQSFILYTHTCNNMNYEGIMAWKMHH